MQVKPVMLIILDGFGLREDQTNNAIALANTPNIDYYMQNKVFGKINASEQFVGLPKGQFGNSEVGHINIGAGRIVRQDITEIDHAIAQEDFISRFDSALSGTLHIMGLISDGGVHSHQKHIYELIKLSSHKVDKIYLHLFLDGRDTPPQSAIRYLEELQAHLNEKVQIATISGRYYAMDRDNRWDRVKLAYDSIVLANNQTTKTPLEVVKEEYQKNITDEFVVPTAFAGYTGMKSGDNVIFANFRSDRAVQLTRVFVDKAFDGFERDFIDLNSFITMTQYSNDIDATVAFKPRILKNTLGEYISTLGHKQLRIAETEKYPHITYFFNGGKHEAFTNEERVLIDSPKDVATYDLKPEMSLPQVSTKLKELIATKQYKLIITNFANGDMVGHTGSLDASIKAVEALDKYVKEVVDTMCEYDGEILIIADHGNCEQMFDNKSHQVHTQHTTNLVPCIYIGRDADIVKEGSLQDVAPTLLAMMGLQQPKEMTGSCLLKFS